MSTTPLLEKYRKGDLVQFFNNILEIITEEKSVELKIEAQRKDLAVVMERFNRSWQPNKGSELTPQIQELDVLRDSLFVGLKLTVDAWSAYHYDEGVKNAAFLLSDKIAAHGSSIQILRYQQETATLNALLLDFTTELEKEVALLGLTEWVVKLQQTNSLFNEKYVARAKALSSEQEGIVVQLRAEATEAFRSLRKLFEARMEIAKVESANFSVYEKVQNQLNELTQQYNEAVLKANSKEKEATD